MFGELHTNFTIDSVTGIIKPIKPLDFELLEGPSKENVRPLYLTVRARDWGVPSLFSDIPLVIYVEDMNDNAPTFEFMFYNKTIPENLVGGTSILQVY